VHPAKQTLTLRMHVREVIALRAWYVSFRLAHGPRMASNTSRASNKRVASNALIVGFVGVHRI
jgi:hypothetical protein